MRSEQGPTINPLQVKKSQEVLRDFKNKMKETEVSVIISKSPCPLFEARRTKKQKKIVFRTDQSKSCADCKTKCLTELGCPAFHLESSDGVEHVLIDEFRCSGCSVCSQICDSNQS